MKNAASGLRFFSRPACAKARQEPGNIDLSCAPFGLSIPAGVA